MLVIEQFNGTVDIPCLCMSCASAVVAHFAVLSLMSEFFLIFFQFYSIGNRMLCRLICIHVILAANSKKAQSASSSHAVLITKGAFVIKKKMP